MEKGYPLLKSILVIGFALAAATLFAQQKMPDKFEEMLRQMELDIAIPVENRFKYRRARKQAFFRTDFMLRSKRSRVEIHYSLIPAENAEFLVPQVSYTRTLANLASNEDQHADIAVHNIDEIELVETFNADWGSTAYFHPKPQIGRYRYGKLLALYKKGRGMAYVLFLFNPGGEATIESLSKAARFTLFQ